MEYPMFGEALVKLLRGGLPPAIAKVEIGLSRGDREAIVADLLPADAAEAGLGAALAVFVVTGEDEAVLLRLDNLVRTGADPKLAQALRDALHPSPYAYGKDKAAQERRLTARRRVLFGLEGFDAPALRRYAAVLDRAIGPRTNFYSVPGSGRSPLWARELLRQFGQYRTHGGTEKPFGFVTAARLRELLTLDGLGVAFLVDLLFVDGDVTYSDHPRHSLDLPDLGDVLTEEAVGIETAVRALGAGGRAAMLGYFGRTGMLGRDPQFLGTAFALAADGSRTVREAAFGALAGAPVEAVRERIEAGLTSRDADARMAAVNALVARFGTEALPRLEEHEAKETTKRILQAIATARASLTVSAEAAPGEADGPGGYVAADGTIVAPPPRAPAPDTVPPEAEIEDLFRDLITAANEAARRDFDAVPAADRNGQRAPKRFEAPYDPGVARRIAAVMHGAARLAEAPKVRNEVLRAVSPSFDPYMAEARRGYMPGLAAFLDRPDVSVQALARLLLSTSDQQQTWRMAMAGVLSPYRGHTAVEQALHRRLAAGADMRDVTDAAEAAGRPTGETLESLLTGWPRPAHPGDEPPNPTIWPILAAHLPLIDRVLLPGGTSRYQWSTESALELMGFFPKLPRRYFGFFLQRASEGSPRLRGRVRALLAQAGDLTPIITPALSDGDAKRRVGAARWLGDRRDPAALPALRTALVKEKNVVARAAVLAALAACGEDISGEFSEEKLLREAEAGLPKTAVDLAPLFDAERPPVLHWADGREVPAKVVQWWFAAAHKLKQPGGDPLLHMALDRLDRADAERLGLAVLSAFIGHDARRPTAEEANAYARAEAPARHQAYLRWNKDYTEEQAFEELRREKLGTYLGSALDHRGLLALARYAPPVDAVAMVKRYLRDHGKRANQCRALIDALMANPVPAVLQLVLATSQRHKQPGTRKYAGEVANALAEERGWTPSELADRTVPFAGLDEDGVLDLPIGGRAFRARLVAVPERTRGKAALKDGGLALVVENPDGKTVSALPSPSDPEGAEEARAAKKALSAAKKELKQTVEIQTSRLYEAMCAGRVWPVAEFETYLLGHPIVGRLLRRLVLTGHGEGGPAGSFRALEDGSFTDAADEPVTTDGLTGITLAHRAVLGEEAAAAWTAHLADYEVTPLFEQLDRPLLAAADAKAEAIEDRKGHMIDNYALRGAAEGLGYVRGAVEDGGCFYTYEKAFAELGVAAVIEFTGSYMPETEKRPGALKVLSFARLRAGDAASWNRAALPLGKVPPVLLSEAWNDLHAIAAAGTGFDPDWEKKGLW